MKNTLSDEITSLLNGLPQTGDTTALAEYIAGFLTPSAATRIQDSISVRQTGSGTFFELVQRACPQGCEQIRPRDLRAMQRVLRTRDGFADATGVHGSPGPLSYVLIALTEWAITEGSEESRESATWVFIQATIAAIKEKTTTDLSSSALVKLWRKLSDGIDASEFRDRQILIALLQHLAANSK